MRTYQSVFDVQIEIFGDSQRMLVEFTTPSDIIQSDFSLENIVVPEGSNIETNNIYYVGPTGDDRKKWGIGIYYNPSQIGISTYTMNIRNERYYITSTYKGATTA